MQPQPTTANLPIGVFDSGLGGLTVVKAIQYQLPNEAIVYYGDTAHLPYGDKSPATLRGYVEHIVAWLLALPVKAIVVACNTASAAAIERVQELAGSVPVVEVVHPAVQAAVAASTHGHIGVIATKTTIGSRIYPKTLHRFAPSARMEELATPLLVPMIEEGHGMMERIADTVLASYLSDPRFQDIDTLILGCTHYPLVRERVVNYFAVRGGQPVHVVDASAPTTHALALRLTELNLLRGETAPALADRYVVSDIGAAFQASASLFFERAIELEHQPLG